MGRPPKAKTVEVVETEETVESAKTESTADIDAVFDENKKVAYNTDDDLTDIVGVGKETANKLIAGGFKNFMAVATASPNSLEEKCGIGSATAGKIIEEAKKLAKIGEFITGYDLKQKMINQNKLTTCSTALDNLFKNPLATKNGIPTQSITEFFGEFGSGKTQLCFQLAVNATMPIEKGGLGGEVIYIDTENTFRQERIVQIAEGLGLDGDEVLKKIHHMHVYNSAHQMLAVEKGAYELANVKNIKLLIVDSLTSHFRSEYIGRGVLAERQGLLSRHMRELNRFSFLTDSVVIVTNQVSAKPDAFFGDPTRPIGGHIVGHSSTYRIYLRKAGKGGKRVARMIDAPEVTEEEVLFNVSEVGVRDDA